MRFVIPIDAHPHVYERWMELLDLLLCCPPGQDDTRFAAYDVVLHFWVSHTALARQDCSGRAGVQLLEGLVDRKEKVVRATTDRMD